MSDRDLIVVTGASGRVGHQVARLLLSEGCNVRVVARTAENLKSLASLGADVRTGAIDDRVFLTTAFRRASAVFLLTPVDTKAQNVNTEQRNNVAGLAGAIRDSGVKSVADMAIEINRGIESGQVHAEPRTKSNTTPTTLEEFARTTFSPAFNAAPNVSFTGKMAGAFLRSFLFFVSPRVHRPLVHKDERVVG